MLNAMPAIVKTPAHTPRHNNRRDAGFFGVVSRFG